MWSILGMNYQMPLVVTQETKCLLAMRANVRFIFFLWFLCVFHRTSLPYNCVGILNENLTLHRCYISHCKTDTCFCLKFVDRLSRKIDVLKIQQSFVKISLQVSLKIMHVYAIFPSPLSVYLCVAALRSSYKCHIVSKQDKLMWPIHYIRRNQFRDSSVYPATSCNTIQSISCWTTTKMCVPWTALSL